MPKTIENERYTVDPDKFQKAHTEVEQLLKKTFGTDYDGDANVEFILIDRQRNEKMHFVPQPYTGKYTESELLQCLDRAQLNAEIACGRLDELLTIYLSEKRRKED